MAQVLGRGSPIQGECHLTNENLERASDEIDALRQQAEETRLFFSALEIAFKAHEGQFDKTGQPYILHPLRVMLRAGTIAERTVALLHDVLEDCPEWTVERLSSHFPKAYVAAIQALTRQDHESYPDFITRVRTDPLATNVKLADIADNLDPRRLHQLDEATRVRLVEKYSPALQILAADKVGEA